MTSYTKAEIRSAVHGTGLTLAFQEKILEKLRKMKDDHVHDFTDDDMISVKEIREAWMRKYPGSFPLRNADCPDFLKDISEHREPEYPDGTIWQDKLGLIYQRSGKKWLRFGTQTTWADSYPSRPLERMDVIK